MEPEKLKERLSAVCVVLHTPFKDSEELDIDGLRRNVSFLVESAAKSKRNLVLIPTGTAGEFFNMSDEERKKVISVTIEEANGKVPVVAGTACAGTRQTLILSKYAEDAGADGVMVVLPYYVSPNEEGMYMHYKTLAENLEIGIMVYNNIDATKSHIDPPLMERIIELPNIISLKECSLDMHMWYEMMKFEGRIRVIHGKGELPYAMVSHLGCSGFVSLIANWYPEYSLEVLDAGLTKDFKRLWELIKKLEPYRQFVKKVLERRKPTSVLCKYFTREFTYYGISKAAADLCGLCGGRPRSPLSSLDEKEKKELKEVLQEIGALKS
jgi:4-hydroxy-tetrahydrodipicolinate synthase